jgi:hypothetical protein
VSTEPRPPSPDEDGTSPDGGAGAKDFWSKAPGLAAVRGWARARRAGPYALLGEILLQVMARVPPNVMLPPLGSYDKDHTQGAASLNQIFASVGASGLSKGLAHAISAQVMQWPEGLDSPVYAALGTGEGIAATFVACQRDPETKKYEMTRLAWSAVLSATEVDKFAALITRKNATLGGTLRSAWSGEPLGEANATEDKRRYVPRDTYRLGIVVHVQPGRGGALLNEEETAGGTPQRILWLPARDPDIPDIAPDPPRRIVWQPPDEITKANNALKVIDLDHIDGLKPVLLPVCERALSEIDRAAVARHRGESGALDGHALLVREKLAASLGIFLGHFGVTDDDWELAGHLMSVSSATREDIGRELRRVAEQENDARGRAEAKRAKMVRQAEESDAILKASQRILKILAERQDWTAHSDLRRTVGFRHRDYYDDAIERLLKEERIEKRDALRTAGGHGGNGIEYRLPS